MMARPRRDGVERDLLLGVFEGKFAEFLHQFFQFERSLASTGTGGFVGFFSLQSSVSLETFEGGVDFVY